MNLFFSFIFLFIFFFQLKLPPGLINIGNTCYMNATLQCLHSIPELRENLARWVHIDTPPFILLLFVSNFTRPLQAFCLLSHNLILIIINVAYVFKSNWLNAYGLRMSIKTFSIWTLLNFNTSLSLLYYFCEFTHWIWFS